MQNHIYKRDYKNVKLKLEICFILQSSIVWFYIFFAHYLYSVDFDLNFT